METIALLNSTGDTQLDRILQGIIRLIELSFPARVRSYYLTGSYADGTATSTSDVDVLIVLKSSATQDEVDKIFDIADALSLLSPMFLDLEGTGEDQALSKGYYLKLSGLHLYGEDIRPLIQMPSLDDYVRDCMYGSAIHFMTRVVRRQQPIIFPLDYPDRDGEFYGYDYNLLEQRRDTKPLMAIVGHAATAMVALKTRQYVAAKSECLTLYAQHIGDGWTALIEQVTRLCRNQWQYRIPEDEAERETLRDICRRTLAFENHFLELYRDFLLAELHSNDEHNQLKAVKAFGEIIFAEQRVVDAINALKTSTDADLARAALDVGERIEKVFR